MSRPKRSRPWPKPARRPGTHSPGRASASVVGRRSGLAAWHASTACRRSTGFGGSASRPSTSGYRGITAIRCRSGLSDRAFANRPGTCLDHRYWVRIRPPHLHRVWSARRRVRRLLRQPVRRQIGAPQAVHHPRDRVQRVQRSRIVQRSPEGGVEGPDHRTLQPQLRFVPRRVIPVAASTSAAPAGRRGATRRRSVSGTGGCRRRTPRRVRARPDGGSRRTSGGVTRRSGPADRAAPHRRPARSPHRGVGSDASATPAPSPRPRVRQRTERFADRRPAVAHPLVRVAAPIGEEQILTRSQSLGLGGQGVKSVAPWISGCYPVAFAVHGQIRCRVAAFVEPSEVRHTGRDTR